MIVGFVVGFVAAYIGSAAIAIVVSQSVRAASSLGKVPEVPLIGSSKAEIDGTLFDELRCI